MRTRNRRETLSDRDLRALNKKKVPPKKIRSKSKGRMRNISNDPSTKKKCQLHVVPNNDRHTIHLETKLYTATRQEKPNKNIPSNGIILETELGDVHTEHLAEGLGQGSASSGLYSLHSSMNLNSFTSRQDLKKKYDKNLYVLKAGSKLQVGSKPVVKTSRSLLNHFGNFLLFYLTLYTLVGGGGCCKHEKARHNNKNGATKIHALLWNKYQPNGYYFFFFHTFFVLSTHCLLCNNFFFNFFFDWFFSTSFFFWTFFFQQYTSLDR